jgi:DNA processing protein
MMDQQEIVAWLQLRLLPEMSRVRFYALIDHFQTPEFVLGAGAAEIAALRGFDKVLARKVLEAPKTVEVESELELMEKHGARLLTLECDEYPDNLRVLSFPPPVLYVRGAIQQQDRFSVAIVGSRNATTYGRAAAQQFATRLASVGLTIISGFARGIDAAAHQAALAMQGRTIAVLGCGLAVNYPTENFALGNQIAESGALVSEYPMQTSPDRFNFPERNHLIAAMSLGTLVVEAAEKSGALITANDALEEGRFVFALPGDITRQNSRGSNALIQAGARLVQSPDEIVLEMRDQLREGLREDKESSEDLDRENTASNVRSIGAGANIVASLSAEEQEIVDMIRHEPQYFDVLASRVDPAKIPVQRLSAILLALELKQVIRQQPGRLYVIASI